MKSEKQLQEEREESLGYDNSKSLNPERDELWAKHDGLTPKCCAEMIALAGKLEQERNVWKHEAEIVRKQLESEHETAISLFIEFYQLKNAVAETLEENRHLADGDQCTLKKLKDAYAKAGTSLDSENVKGVAPLLARADVETEMEP
jgi:hypothetical protein